MGRRDYRSFYGRCTSITWPRKHETQPWITAASKSATRATPPNAWFLCYASASVAPGEAQQWFRQPIRSGDKSHLSYISYTRKVNNAFRIHNLILAVCAVLYVGKITGAQQLRRRRALRHGRLRWADAWSHRKRTRYAPARTTLYSFLAADVNGVVQLGTFGEVFFEIRQRPGLSRSQKLFLSSRSMRPHEKLKLRLDVVELAFSGGINSSTFISCSSDKGGPRRGDSASDRAHFRGIATCWWWRRWLCGTT